MTADISTIHHISQPGLCAFVLQLPNSSELMVDAVVRVLPGRRLVCHAAWNGQAVFAKLFIGQSAAAYARRDREGSQWLEAAQILTPKLLYSASISQEMYVLIYAAIEHAHNAEDNSYQQLQPRCAIAKLLVNTLAQHHLAGLIQTDLHLKNFLVRTDASAGLQIYTLDGDGIRRLRSWGASSTRLSNLATLFSKFDVLDDASIPELYRQYCAAIGESHSVSDERHVIKLVWRIRHRVSRTYADKKVFRTCTDVTVKKSFRYFHAVAADSLINPQTVNLDTYLADSKANLKNGNTCTVGLGNLANQRVVIKRYNIKNLWHGITRALRPSRAAVSWANAHRLLISNIATPKPLALIEMRWGLIRRHAYFLSAYVDAPDVAQFFMREADVERQMLVAQNLATVFLKLYLHKYTHGDCKASNIKVIDLKPVLIDLDSMRSYGRSCMSNWLFEQNHVKDLKRFMKNWEDKAAILTVLRNAFQSTYPDTAKHVLIRAGIV